MYDEVDGSIIIDTEIQTDGMVPGTKEVEQAIRTMSDTIKKMGINAQMSLQKQVDSVSKLNRQYAEQEKKIETIRKKMEALAGEQVETSEYKQLGEELRQLEVQFDAVERKEREWRQIGIPVDSAGYQVLEKQLDDIYYQMDKVQQKQAQMRNSGTAYVDKTGTQQYLALQNQLIAEEGRLSDMNNRLGTTYASLKQKVSATSPEITKLRGILNSSVSPLQKVKSVLAALKEQLLGTDSGQKKVSDSGKKMNRTLKSTSKNANSARMSMGYMLKNALLIGLAMRAVITVMEGFGVGMNNLVQYSDRSNKVMSALMSSMTMLKNSFATAFSPLIEIAQPALTKFIYLLAEAVTWTAQLIAALTGKDTFTKAVKVQQDYADSLDKTADETKDVAKETQKAIAPFDELIQIIRTKTVSSSGSDKEELKPEDMFTTEEVTNTVKLQAEEIKKIFGTIFEPMKKSWDNHGNYAVQASKAAFNSLKQLAKDIGASFLQVWNDEGYGEKISADLIITFGNLAYTVSNLGNRFSEAWVKADNGTNIIRHIGDIILLVSGFFRQASADIKDWAAELDFEPLLVSFDNVLEKMNPVVKKIGEMLLWLLNKVFLPLAKWALECGVPGVLDVIAAGFEFLAAVLEALEPLAMWLWNDFLQPFGKWAGEVVISAIKQVVEWLTKFSEWIERNQEKVQYITELLVAFFVAWKAIEFVEKVSKMIRILSGAGGFIEILSQLGLSLSSTRLLYLGVAGGIAAVVTAIINIAKYWDKMTPSEKVIASILAAAAAVGILAVALGAISGGIGAAVVAASLAAAIAASMIAIKAGKRQVEDIQSSFSGTHGGGSTSFGLRSAGRRNYSVPALASGTVVPPRAGEFLAMLGDNNRETEVVSPLSTMKQAVLEALEAYGGGPGGKRPIQIDMYVEKQKFARIIHELNSLEDQRVGVRLVTKG